MSYTNNGKRINWENQQTIRHPLTTHIIVGENDCFHTPYLTCRNLGSSLKPTIMPATSDQYARIQSLSSNADEFDWYCFRRGFNLRAATTSNKITALINAEAAWKTTENNGVYTQTVQFTVPAYTLYSERPFTRQDHISICFAERGEKPMVMTIRRNSSTIASYSHTHRNLVVYVGSWSEDDVFTITLSAPEDFKLACCSLGLMSMFTEEAIISANTSLRSNLDYTSMELPVSSLDAYIGVLDNVAGTDTFFNNIFTELPIGAEINLWQGYQDPITVGTTLYQGEMVNRKFYRASGDEFCTTEEGNRVHLQACDTVKFMMNRQTGDMFLTKDGNGYCAFPGYFLEDYDVQGANPGESFWRKLDLGYNPSDNERGTNPQAKQKLGRYPFILGAMNQAARTIGNKDIVIQTSRESASQASNAILNDGTYLTNESTYGPYDNRTLHLGSTDPVPPGDDFLAYVPSSSPRTFLQQMMNIFGRWTQPTYTSKTNLGYTMFQPVYVDAGIPTITAGQASSVLTIDRDQVTDLKSIAYQEYRQLKIKTGRVVNFEGTIALDNMTLLMEKTARGYGTFTVAQQGGGQVYSDFWIKVTDSLPDDSGNYTNVDVTESATGFGTATPYARDIERRTYDYPCVINGHNTTQTRQLKIQFVWDNDNALIHFYSGIPEGGQRNIQIYGQPFKKVEKFEKIVREQPTIDGQDADLDYEMYLTNALFRLGHNIENSNTGLEFTWRGDPRLQPRDVINYRSQTYTIESIETKYEEGGTLSTITARKGFV